MNQWPFLMVLDFEDQVYLDIKGFRWVDDTLFLKPADGSNPATMRDIAEASERLGVETNEKKWREFDNEQKYLGFVWNGVEKTIRLPEEKIILRMEQIQEYAQKEKQSFKNTEVLVGRLKKSAKT